VKRDAFDGTGELLGIEPEMSPDDALRRLQVNALAVHQRSMGRGDELVQILATTVKQLERSHTRIQTMSTILFGVGIVAFATGLVAVLFGHQQVWVTVIGGVGGLMAFAAVFWTGPMDRVAASVTSLVKLEAAFLGYIRWIGEVDSFFQMQYLDIVRGTSQNGDAKTSLAQAITNTTNQMKEAMSHTVTLIDEHVPLPAKSLSALEKQIADMTARVKELEGA
jgi:hypothetical protein